MKIWLFSGALVVLLVGLPVLAADVTAPGDPIVGIPGGAGDWPTNEAPPNAIDDNVNTKYLNFRAADPQPTGFRVTPSKKETIVVGLSFTTANDAPERDPVAWRLSGSNEGIDGPYTEIASGRIADFEQPTAWPRFTKTTTPIVFANTTPYDHYELLVTAVRNPGAANSMQVAEVELLDGTPSVDGGGPYLLRLPETTLQLQPTVIDLDSAPEDFTYLWSQRSGPATVDFGGTETLPDATVTFPAEKGIYELFVQVFDEMGNDANDVVTVRVWDPETEDVMVAHWAFNEGQGMVANDSTSWNDAGVLGARPEGQIPTWVAGWIPGDAPSDYALEFASFGYVEVDPNALAPSPNLDDLTWSISIAGWFNAADWDGNRRILQKGGSDNQYRLLAENGQLVFDLSGVGRLEGPLPAAQQWHHVAATYDGMMMRLYLDGMEAASIEASGLIDTTEDLLFIGTKSKDVDPTQHPGDYFLGQMDDLRVYNYPLSPSEVLDLVAMGVNAPPHVTLTDPGDLVLSVRNYLDLDATGFDVNEDEIFYKWTAAGPAAVTFEPSDTVEDPRVFFTEAGTYTLRVAVDDGMFGLDGSIFAEVQIEVSNPTCADVIAAGLGLFGDANEDCHVDLADFAEFAANWLLCNDPLDDNCINPFAIEPE